MFEPGRDGFAVNETFVMHSLIAAQGLVLSAQSALGQLHDSCDLTVVTDEPLTHELSDDTVEPEIAEFVESDPEPEPIPFSPRSSSARFVQQVTSSAANQEFAEILTDRQPVRQEEERRVLQEGFAQNYLELLRKLTAAEIFAAEQQALSPPGTQHQLLPLLRSLREDFQKIHSAA